MGFIIISYLYNGFFTTSHYYTEVKPGQRAHIESLCLLSQRMENINLLPSPTEDGEYHKLGYLSIQYDCEHKYTNVKSYILYMGQVSIVRES